MLLFNNLLGYDKENHEGRVAATNMFKPLFRNKMRQSVLSFSFNHLPTAIYQVMAGIRQLGKESNSWTYSVSKIYHMQNDHLQFKQIGSRPTVKLEPLPLCGQGCG